VALIAPGLAFPQTRLLGANAFRPALGDEKFPIRELCIAGSFGMGNQKICRPLDASLAH